MTVVNGNECLVCSSTCRTCSSYSYCTACYPTNFLFNGTCLTLCPNMTYSNATLQQCVGCINPCLQCVSSSYCITCANPSLYVDAGGCVPVCSGTQIPIGSICTPCNIACSTCASTVSNCIVCTNGYFKVYSNVTVPNCVASCPSYIYNNTVGTGNMECLTACPAQYYAVSLGS